MFKKYIFLFLLSVGAFSVGNMANAAGMCEDQSNSWCKNAQRCADRLEWCKKNGPQELAMYLANQPSGQRDTSSDNRGTEAYRKTMSSMPNVTRTQACLQGCGALQAAKLCTGNCV